MCYNSINTIYIYIYYYLYIILLIRVHAYTRMVVVDKDIMRDLKG